MAASLNVRCSMRRRLPVLGCMIAAAYFGVQPVQAQTVTWIAPAATGNASGTNQWDTGSNWSTGSAPNAAGAFAVFSGTWNQGTNNVQLLGSATTTIGSITMTNTGTGSTSTTGKLNLGSTSGTATLKLDSGGASQPVINYTTGGQFDNFLNVVLTGSQGYDKTGAGVIQVSGFNNTYSGTTKITGGGVRFRSNANLGDPTSAGPIQLNGGTLFLRSDAGSVALDDRAAFANAPGANKRNMSVSAGTQGNPSSLNLELTAGGTTVLEITGNLTSSTSTAWFRKTGGGTLNLRGSANYMQGPMQLDSGTTNMSGALNTFSGLSIGVSNTTTATAPAPVLNWTGSGTVAIGNASLVVNDAGSSTTPMLRVTSGTLTIGNGTSNGGFYVGGKGSGTASVDGGLLLVTANKAVSLGAFLQFGNSNGRGILNILSGTMRTSGTGEFNVGYAQTNATASGTFAGTGIVNLTGGVLETGRSMITGSSAQAIATGTFNFNGGVLRALSSNTNFLTVTTANVQNGAIIDTNAFDLTIAQPLLNGGSGGLTKQNAGTLTLSASNSYAGNTVVSGGTLKAGNAAAFSSGAVTVASGAALDLNALAIGNAITNNGGTVSDAASYAGTQTLNGPSTFAALGGTLTVASGGAATLGGALSGVMSIAAGGTATLTDGGSLSQASLTNNGQFVINRSGTSTVSTAIGGSGALRKLGSGRVNLTGTSDYAGATVIDDGSLIVTGLLSGSGAVTVASGATLGGNGTLSGPISVLSGGIIAPGTSPGTLAAISDFTLDGASILNFELSGTNTTVGDGINDLITVGGNLTLSGTLNVAELSSFTNVSNGTKWRLFNYTGTLTGTSLTFGSMPTLQDGQSFQVDTTTVNEVNLVVVPEPHTLAVVGIGAFLGWRLARRRLRGAL